MAALRRIPAWTVGWLHALVLTAVVGWLLWQVVVERDALATLAGSADAGSLLLACTAAAAAYGCLFVAWLLMIRMSGCYVAGQVGAYAHAWWRSYLLRYVPGKVLLLVERVRLGKALGIPPPVGAALVVIETLLAVIAGCLAALLAAGDLLTSSRRITVVLVVVPLIAIAATPLLLRVVAQTGFVIRRFPELAAVRFPAGTVMLLTVPYVLHYLLLGTAFFVLGNAAGLFEVGHFAFVCGVYALSFVAGLVVAFAPGGIGIREGALAAQLAWLVPAGVAGMLAIAARLLFTLVELLWLAVAVLLARAKGRGDSA